MDIDIGQWQMKHQLFEELDAADPRWQAKFRTLREAVEAYDLGELFGEFLQTDDGQRYLAATSGVKDWRAVNARNRRQRAAELKMAGSTPNWKTDEDQGGWDE